MKNKILLSIVALLLFAASAFAETVDLSTLTGDYVAQDKDVLTGELVGDYKISIADNATVTLSGVTINGTDSQECDWSGLTCEGDCEIILAENTVNVVTASYSNSGIFVPESKTLTISGSGTLEANGRKSGPGIGSVGKLVGESLVKGGNIVLSGGTIIAKGAGDAAGIGTGGLLSSMGDITITDGVIKAVAIMGLNANYSIGGSGLCLEIGSITIGGVVTGNISTSPFTYPTGKYTVVYDANGGEGVMADQTPYYGFKEPLNANSFTREGYTFTGWNTKADGLGTDYKDGTVVSTLAEAGESITLYAMWLKDDRIDISKLKDHYVAQDGDLLTGTLDGKTKPYKISIADGAAVSLNNVTINGVDDKNYDWAGITCECNCTIILERKNKVSGFYSYNPGIKVPENCTLTISGSGKLDAISGGDGAGIGARREENNGNIVIKSGVISAMGGHHSAGIGGTWARSFGNITIEGGTVMAEGGLLSAAIGGFSEAGGGDITITDGVTKVVAIKYNNDRTLYSIGNQGNFRPTITIGGVITKDVSADRFEYPMEKYTVVFDANGGDGTMDNQMLNVDFEQPLNANGFTRHAMVFVGWNTEADGSGSSYENLSYVENLAEKGGSVTLYAQWVKENFVSLSDIECDYVAKNGDVLTGTLSGNYKISIADGAVVTLDNVSINGVNDEAYNWAGISCEGDCDIILADKSVNSVKGFYANYPGVFVPVGNTLTISGTGSLNASSNGSGAGIGGGNEISCGNIVIRGGVIVANGGVDAAGIGGGYRYSVGHITIADKGVKVIATKGPNAPYSIGVGSKSFEIGAITIGSLRTTDISESPFVFTGETYTVAFDANGGDGVMASQVLYSGFGQNLHTNEFTRDGLYFFGWNTKADGSGKKYADESAVVDLTESGKSITLYAQWVKEKVVSLSRVRADYVAQDGDVLKNKLSGNYKISIADGATVTLNGVTIIGTNADYCKWAGITCEGDCNIVLAENSVNTVKGFYWYYPGIYVPEGKTLTILGTGSLNASSNGLAAGIGGGRDLSSGDIVISGGTITATGGDRSAGIGGGVEGTVGNITITDDVTKVTAIKGNENSYSVGAGEDGSRSGIITIGGKEFNDVEDSLFVYPAVAADYPAVQVYKYNSGVRAVINADYAGVETLRIPDPIVVNSVEVKRNLTSLTPATTVLPFTLPEGTTLNARFYYVKAVEQEGCSWNATMKYIGTGKLPEANTPYAVILNEDETSLKFDMHGNTATLQTGDIADRVDSTGKWYFKGLYSYKEWKEKDGELGLAYAFAGSNDDGVAKGEFGRIVAGAYAVPMRSYLRKKDASVRLNCAAAARAWGAGTNNAGIANANANVITVNFVEDDENGEEKTTAVGHLNSVTGEFTIDRWYDLKGRRVNNVNPATKGAYYGKKVLKK